VRRFALNLLTVSGTVVVLALVSLPAWSVHERVHDRARPTSRATALSVVPRPVPRRLFGVYVDPWHLSEWSARVGARPSLVAKFEAFSRRRTADRFLRQVARDHLARAMVSWEPWKPVPARLGWRRQAQSQPGYTNREIAAGVQDAYIARFARSLARFHGVVYLRYAHEMNGFWYPWSADAGAYVRAWRHIVRVVRKEGARNVRFVWSVNPNLYETRPESLRNLRRYWPGAPYVDAVGSTMINFGGAKDYTVARFEPALVALRRVFHKPVYLTETNTGRAGRVRWLRDLRRMVGRHRWVRAVVWSQLPSRGQAQQRRVVGDLNWNVTGDRAAAAVLRGIARDGSQ
jgi:glycosyl hydrolase family 26